MLLSIKLFQKHPTIQVPTSVISIHYSAGSPPRTDTASVTITVLDVNESPPTFMDAPYTATVAENTAVDTSLLTVRASDPDLGENGTVTYSISGDNTRLLR